VSRWQQCREDFSVVASKPPPLAKNASREVNIGKDTVRKTVVEDFRKRKICSRFVSHSLTPEQKDRRIAACRNLIATADSDIDFYKKTVNGDETWCFAYDPTTKRQSAA